MKFITKNCEYRRLRITKKHNDQMENVDRKKGTQKQNTTMIKRREREKNDSEHLIF